MQTLSYPFIHRHPHRLLLNCLDSSIKKLCWKRRFPQIGHSLSCLSFAPQHETHAPASKPVSRRQERPTIESTVAGPEQPTSTHGRIQRMQRPISIPIAIHACPAPIVQWRGVGENTAFDSHSLHRLPIGQRRRGTTIAPFASSFRDAVPSHREHKRS